MNAKQEKSALSLEFVANIGQKTTLIPVQLNPLLLPPKKIEPDENMKVQQVLSMCWLGEFKKNAGDISVDFSYIHNTTTLKISFTGERPTEINDIAIAKGYLKALEQNRLIYSYNFTETKEENEFTTNNPNSSLNNQSSLASSPLVNHDDKPCELDISELANLLNTKQVAIYTGAGISAGIVPTMTQLEEEIGLIGDNKTNFLCFVKHCLTNPQESLSVLSNFFNACLNGKPTDAHYAVKKISELKGWAVLTENIDLLHQSTGILPLGRACLNTSHDPEILKKIDLILTIGLATDESGFLNQYKKFNPNAIVASINLNSSNYLSNKDYLIKGDAQKILPILYEELLEFYSKESLLINKP